MSRSEFPRGEDIEKSPYYELDAWLKDVKLGDPKFLILSDHIARSQAESFIRLNDVLSREKGIARLAQVEEKIREREDTIPGYMRLKSEFEGIIGTSIKPYEEKFQRRQYPHKDPQSNFHETEDLVRIKLSVFRSGIIDRAFHETYRE